MDLCFVPEVHPLQEKLPAVSGSSGHLVIERSRVNEEQPSWPGQVFANSEMSFEEAMQAYVQATQDRLAYLHLPKELPSDGATQLHVQLEGRTPRHRVLQKRRQEDREWRAAKMAFHLARLAYRQLPKAERNVQREHWLETQAQWKQRREQHQDTLQKRKKENRAWHQRHRALRAESGGEPVETRWIAVLVVIDNCTRQCLGLPIFPSGSKVTGQEVIDALRPLLPAHLRFLISDQGSHFKTKILSQLAQELGFHQVFAFRHRPQSNGIAERFVRTFKHWLRSRSWNSKAELHHWMAAFLPEYNDRPHQGLDFPGLSPNEFANRLQLNSRDR